MAYLLELDIHKIYISLYVYMNMQNDLRMENVPLNLIKDLCAVATNPYYVAHIQSHILLFSAWDEFYGINLWDI